MSVLIRAGRRVEDPYQAIDDETALPATGAILVSLSRWQREAAVLTARRSPLGVRLPNTADVTAVGPGLLTVDLIVLDFPSFADGRAYSQARLLREAQGFRGELRATGAAVVRDQLLAMIRCGIDSFMLRGDQSADACEQALHEFSLAYQPAVDALPNVRALRRAST